MPGRLAAAGVVALGLVLGGCSTSLDTQPGQVNLPDPPPQRATAPTPAQREHERILSSYSGAYEDQRLE